MKVSVVIPTYNREKTLKYTLLSLNNQTYKDFQVLLIDDGSKYNIQDYINNLDINYNLKLIKQENKGASEARNTGILQAGSDIILFIDDDVIPDKNLINFHLKAHKNNDKLLVRGPIINVENLTNLPEKVNLFKYISFNYFCTSNASVYKKHLLKAGLFDKNFKRWEDAELGVRLRKLGLKFKFILNAYVFHLKPKETIKREIEISYLDGISAANLYKKYPTLRTKLAVGDHILNKIFLSLLDLLFKGKELSPKDKLYPLYVKYKRTKNFFKGYFDTLYQKQEES